MSLKGAVYDALTRVRAATGIGRHRNYGQMEVAVVLLLPPEVDNLVRALQFGILGRLGRCPGIDAPPHVTLKMGFKSSNLTGLADGIAEFARQTDLVEIHISGVSHFDEGVLFLDVEKSSAFEALRQSLLTTLHARYGVMPNEFEGDLFHPHVTVVRDLPRHAALDERARLSGLDADFRFVCDRITILASVDGCWIDYMNCPLASEEMDANTPGGENATVAG